MLISKLKPALVAVLVAAALGAGAGVTRFAGGEEPKKPTPPAAKPAAKAASQDDELRKLLGAWHPKTKDVMWTDSPLIFAGERVMFALFPSDVEQRLRGQRADMRVVINPARTPKEMTLFTADDLVQLIYELDGDTLRIGACEDPSVGRPRSFKSAPGEAVKVLEYKRK